MFSVDDKGHRVLIWHSFNREFIHIILYAMLEPCYEFINVSPFQSVFTKYFVKEFSFRYFPFLEELVHVWL